MSSGRYDGVGNTNVYWRDRRGGVTLADHHLQGRRIVTWSPRFVSGLFCLMATAALLSACQDSSPAGETRSLTVHQNMNMNGDQMPGSPHMCCRQAGHNNKH